MVLHTFGRDLKWNPHIHCLLSEGGFSDDGFWRHVSHFNYSYLRNAFRTALLNEMHSKIGPSFKKIKSKCYNDHKQGFYVYAKPNLSDSKTVIKYIGRYLGRPVIATSRIDNYDGDTVTFHYNRHEDNKYIVETLPAIDFIKRLIRHIPEEALQNDSIWWLICQTSKNRRKTLSCDLEKQTSYLPEFQPMADCHSFFFWL
ncbi:MAG: transposase [Coprococcus phoceensis]